MLIRAFRKWLRAKLKAEIATESAKAKAFLVEFPWLAQLVPLGYWLGNCRVQRVDIDMLFRRKPKGRGESEDERDPDSFEKIYLVTSDGEVLMSVRGWIRGWGKPESVYKAFLRLRKKVDRVRYIVGVRTKSVRNLPGQVIMDQYTSFVISRFPKDVTRKGSVAELLSEYEAAEAKRIRTDSEVLQQEISKAKQEIGD